MTVITATSAVCPGCHRESALAHIAAYLTGIVSRSLTRYRDSTTSTGFLNIGRWFFGASAIIAVALYASGGFESAAEAAYGLPFATVLAWWGWAHDRQRQRRTEDRVLDTLTMAREMGFFITANDYFPRGLVFGVSTREVDAHPVVHARWREVTSVEDIDLMVQHGEPFAVLEAQWIAKGTSLRARLRRRWWTWREERRARARERAPYRAAPPRDPTVL